MSRRQRERYLHLQAVEDEYGFEEVLPSRVARIAEEVIRPGELGLSEIRSRRFAAVAGEDIVHLLELFPTKGASYYVRWGLSLGYMPHKWSPKLQWHRTFKSARFDLWESPIEYFGIEEDEWRELETFLVDRLHGEIYLRKSLNQMWARLEPTVREWFESTRSLTGVLKAVEKQLKRSGASSHHSPPLSLVHTFTLCRLGEVEQAESALDAYFRESDTDEVARESLVTALRSISKV